MENTSIKKENTSSRKTFSVDVTSDFYAVKRTPLQLTMPEHMMQELCKTIRLEVHTSLSMIINLLSGVVFAIAMLGSPIILLVMINQGEADAFVVTVFVVLTFVSYPFMKYCFQRGTKIPRMHINKAGVKVMLGSEKRVVMNWGDITPSTNTYDAHDVSFSIGGRNAPPELVYFDKSGEQKIGFFIHRRASELSPTKNAWRLQRAMLGHLALNASESLILDREVFIVSEVHPITWERVKFAKIWYLGGQFLPVLASFALVLLPIFASVNVEEATWQAYVLTVGLFIGVATWFHFVAKKIFYFLYPEFSHKTFQYFPPPLKLTKKIKSV